MIDTLASSLLLPLWLPPEGKTQVLFPAELVRLGPSGQVSYLAGKALGSRRWSA